MIGIEFVIVGRTTKEALHGMGGMKIRAWSIIVISIGVNVPMILGMFHDESRIEAATIVESIETQPVAAGTFTMGRTEYGDDIYYRDADEVPRHEVTLSAYEIGKYEVTNGQYCEVLNWAYLNKPLENWDGSPYSEGDVYVDGHMIINLYVDRCQILFEDGIFIPKTRDGHSMEDFPVVEVTWHGAVAFCNWLSEMVGLTPAYDLASWELIDTDSETVGVQFTYGYRLPTEAEWERAAAWDGARHWIYAYQADVAWSKKMNYGEANPLEFTDYPYFTPVGYYDGNNGTFDSPSPVGAYDMNGNVWEWCHDRYHADYYDSGPVTNPTGPETGSDRVARGGCWLWRAQQGRTASRNKVFPSYSAFTSGFRVARTPATAPTPSPTPSSTPTTTPSPTPIPFEQRGDVNGDGNVDRVDASLLRSRLIGLAMLNSDSMVRADANLDRLVDVGDLIWICKYRRIENTEQYGTIRIDVTPETGGWILTTPENYIFEGLGDQILYQMATGDYELQCKDNIEELAPPTTEHDTLTSGALILFQAAWH